jgi:hypothetical protein
MSGPDTSSDKRQKTNAAAENPTHPQQNAFFERLEFVLGATLGDAVQVHREAQVPSRATYIDGLVDMRGVEFRTGLFPPLARWCQDRLVLMEYEAGDTSAHKLNAMLGKAAMARAGRGQGKQRWPMVRVTQNATLIIVSDRARPTWFETWGMEFEEARRGLWVLEQPFVTVLVVRPYWFGQSKDARLWAFLSNKLGQRTALRLFDALLGDTAAATFDQRLAADLLLQRYPMGFPMNQRGQRESSPQTFDSTNSVWHRMLELSQEREELRTRLSEKEREAREQRARAEEKGELAERLQAELDRLRASGEE